MIDADAAIARLPKAELHIHIEGSLEPELMLALAQRNGVRLAYDSVDALRRAYSFTRLQDFLDLYYQGMSVLRTEQDFYDLASAYLTRVHKQNVRYVEMFFDPQGHTCGVDLATVMGACRSDCRRDEKLGCRSGSSCASCAISPRSTPSGRSIRRFLHDRSSASVSTSETGHPPASSRTSSGARGRKASAGRPCRRRGAAAIRGRRSTCSASTASITAIVRSRTPPVARLARDRMALTVCPLSTCVSASSTISAGIRCGAC
jgi:adenosine deaminase